MKSTKDHLQDWERLEQKWQQKLSTHEEQLPDGLWEKIEVRSKKEEVRRKKGEGLSVKSVQSEKSVQSAKSVVFIRWSAAAAVLLFMFFWIGFEREELKVESGKLKVEGVKGKREEGIGKREEGIGKRDEVRENGLVPELVISEIGRAHV